VPRLRATFEEQGVLDPCTHRYPTSLQARLFFTQMQLLVCEEYSLATLEKSGSEARALQRRTLIQEAAGEMQEGVGLNFIIEITTGRKKL
jgi:hypothetical protein